MWMTLNWLGKSRTLVRHGKLLWKTLIWENQHHFLTMYIWDALKESVKSATILWRTTETCSNPGFLLDPRKNYRPELQGNLMQKQCLLGPMTWKVTQRNEGKILRTCKQNDSTIMQSPNAMHGWSSIQWRRKWLVGELSTVCSQIVLIWLFLYGRPDILWSVNKLARAVTKWTKACVKRLNRLISHIHHTCEYRQYCHVGNTAQQCRLGLFQESDFARDLEDSKSTSGGVLCIFGSHTFVPVSWMCKKQTSVSHSSTEAEIISFGAGSRMGGIPALDLWDLVIEVFRSEPNERDGPKRATVKPVSNRQVKHA